MINGLNGMLRDLENLALRPFIMKKIIYALFGKLSLSLE